MQNKEDEEVQDLGEGHEPTEEVGPDECGAKLGQVELQAGELEEGVDDAHPRFMEEVQDACAHEQIPMVPGSDGLPIPATESSDPAIAPPFTIDHVVCLEDAREYVEVFDDELERYFPESGPPVSVRKKYDREGQESERRRFGPSVVITKWGHTFVHAGGDLLPVRPIRERCEHYRRQVVAIDGHPDPTEFGSKKVFRNCMARRSVGGAFMSVSDEAIYACDYRDPPDPRSTEHYLDAPDREHLKNEAHKVKLPLFRKA